MNRDRLVARLAEMGAQPDYCALAREVLGIRGAPPALAARLVAQALVVEDRRAAWRRVGARIVASAPRAPGVYVLRDANGCALYVGKAIDLRRRLGSHFAERRWRAIKPALARVTHADWIEVGSEIEALLREAALIHELGPIVNVQAGPIAPPAKRRGPATLPSTPLHLERAAHEVVLALPSIEADSVELVAARPDGGWLLLRTRRNGADLAIHTRRLFRFFRRPFEGEPFGWLVYSWLARRGDGVTRLCPADARNERELRTRLAALLGDERLFHERLDQRATL